MNIQVALCLPRDAGTVALVRAVLEDTLGRVGVTANCIDDIRLALAEACNNVIEHADAAHDYEVRIEVDENRCALSVIDSGRPFDVHSLTPEMPDPSSARGRGVAMMHALTDRIDFTSDPKRAPSSTSSRASNSNRGDRSTGYVGTDDHRNMPDVGSASPLSSPAVRAAGRSR